MCVDVVSIARFGDGGGNEYGFIVSEVSFETILEVGEFICFYSLMGYGE